MDVRRIENGAAFVLPSRLNDAFEALVNAGLDLALDERVTELNGLGPTVFLTRMSAAIELLPQLLELQLDGLISIHECDQDVDEETWPSHMAIGSLLCPTTESMRPFADLRGLQGFFLGRASPKPETQQQQQQHQQQHRAESQHWIRHQLQK